MLLVCCRSLSTRLFSGPAGAEKLVEFLSKEQLQGKPLMINKRIANGNDLESALVLALEYLESITKDDVSSHRPKNLKY